MLKLERNQAIKPVTHETGMSLSGMSVDELEARMVLLFEELQRGKSALDAADPASAARSKSAAKQMNAFKEAFPLLSNPES